MGLKKRYMWFFGVILFLVLMGVLIINENLNSWLYSLTFSSIYIYLIFFILFSVLIFIIFDKFKLVNKLKQNKILKFIYILILSPLALYPIFRCYFKIPYVFCHACPNKCIFGYLRPVLIPSALLMNLEKRVWCHQYCSLGKSQQFLRIFNYRNNKFPSRFSSSPQNLGGRKNQGMIRDKAIRKTTFIKYLFLILFVIFYFFFKDNFLKSNFSVSIVVLIVFAVIFLISTFIHRPFCNPICPIGTVSQEILDIENKV